MAIHRWPVLRAAALLLCGAALAACADTVAGPGAGAAPPEARSAPASRPVIYPTTTCASSAMASRGLGTDINIDLNDYGRALYDADYNPMLACVDSAAAIVTTKINNTLNAQSSYFGNCAPTTACGFNAGAVVALIFAAADRIHARGGMTTALDSALRRVEGAYVYNEVSDNCALQSTDNCMDGHSVAASGWGWIAAMRYDRADNPTDVESARANTRLHVHETFNSACIFKGYGQSQLCKTPSTSVTAGDSTISLNLGHRHIPYGFGLMTSVAAAVQGYEFTGQTYSFDAHEKIIAMLLFKEAQAAVSGTAFKTTCDTVWLSGGVWAAKSHTAPCGGNEGYQPQMYALYPFYKAKLDSVPNDGVAGVYQSNVFNDGLFNGDFFSWGRLITYGMLAWDFYLHPRTHLRYVDLYAPQGAVDYVDANGYLQGWACDRDYPSGSVRVTIQAPGKAAISRRADLAHEPGVTAACNGGTAHRYSIQIPADWAGLTVTATALDWFGRRSGTLGCNNCVVPSTSVAWLQPSSVSWGPANTLTAAGYAQSGQGTVKMEWRDVTFNMNPAWNVVAWQPAPDANGQWSNTLPSDNYCHSYQVRSTYSGFTSPVFTYNGIASPYCSETARTIWIQPSSTAGIGSPGALVVAGEARNAPSGTPVTMFYRNVTLNGAWTQHPYNAPTDANGIWYNEIPNANPLHQYAVYTTYDAVTSATCTYQGTGGITWC